MTKNKKKELTGKDQNDILNGHSERRNANKTKRKEKSKEKRKKKKKKMLTSRKKFGILRWQFAKRSKSCE